MNSKEQNNIIAKNTAFLYLRMLISMCISLYTSREILDVLGVEDYGIYNVVGGIVAMFTFLNNAMLTTTQRFLNYYQGKTYTIDKLRTVFSTSINVHVILALVILLLSESIGLYFFETELVIPAERMNAARWVYHTSVLCTIIMVATSPYNALVIARENMNVFAIISVCEVLMKLVIVVSISQLMYDKLIMYSLLMLLSQIIISLSYQQYSTHTFRESNYYYSKELSIFKQMFSFVGWSFIGSAAYISFTQGINILLNLFYGPTINAARGIATQVQSVILGFVSNFQMALNPQITKSYSSGNLDRMHNLVITSCKISFFLLYIITLPIYFECEGLLQLWLIEVPSHTVTFIQLLLITMLIEAVSNPLSISAQATGNIRRYQTVLGALQLLILPISYVVLSIFEIPETVYYVHCIVMIVSQIVRIKFMKNMIGLSLRDFLNKVYLSLIKVIPISIILAVFVEKILKEQNVITIMLRCSIIGFICIFLIISYGLSKNERTFILNLIRRK